MFLKASSTLVESKADVSMKDRVFFSENKNTKRLQDSKTEMNILKQQQKSGSCGRLSVFITKVDPFK